MLKEKIEKVINDYNIQYADIMIYFYDQVVIGRYDNNVLFIPLQYDEELFQEIHIFNQDMELRWSSLSDEIIKIVDTEEKLEESMYIIGNKSVVKDGYSIVTQYGRKVVLPFKIQIKDANHGLRLDVHHLFDDDASICGYRLVQIKGGA